MSPKTSPSLRLLLLCTGLALTPLARAQCDIYWPGIPDFDQRRQWMPLPPPNDYVGLPEEGANYCVPTSSTNCLAVIDSSGYNILTGASAQNWYQQRPLYNQVGTFLGLLGGDYMGTGGINSSGTTFSGGVDGMQDWIDERNLGDRFSSCGFEYDGDSFPKVSSMYNHLKAAHLTMYCFGRWYRDGDQIERDGGHSLTLVGVMNKCSTNTPDIWYHDPNTGDSKFEQAPFETAKRTVYRRHLNMDGDWAYVYAFEQTANGTATEPVRVIDSFRWISSNVALATHPVDPTKLLHIHVSGVWHALGGGSAEIHSPTGGVIISSQYSYIDHTFLVLCAAGASRSGLYRYDPADGSFRRLQEFARNPDRLVMDRFGDYYIQAGASIDRYKLVDDTPTRVAGITLPAPVNAWGIDDATDTIVALTNNFTRIKKLSRAVTVVGDEPVPGGIVLSGDGSVSINPTTGRLWITSSGSPGVYEIVFDDVGRPRTLSQATHAQLRNIRGLAFTDMGHLIASCDGSVRTFFFSAAAGWQPDTTSPWLERGPLAVGRLHEISRSRHNHQVIHEGPAWDNFNPIPDDPRETIVDCGPDFNSDGFLDFFDVDAFVSCFEGLGCPPGRDADYNMDNFEDFFDVDAFIADFEAGC